MTERSSKRGKLNKAGRRKRRRQIGIGVGAVVLVVGGLFLRDALTAKRDLEEARRVARILERDLDDGDIAGARDHVAQLTKRAASAHDATSGVLWKISSRVPLLGRQISAVRTLTGVVDDLATDALGPASNALADVEDDPPFESGVVDLPAIRSLHTQVTRAAAAGRAAQSRLEGMSSGGLLGTLRQGRSDLLREVGRLRTRMDQADRALRLAVPMLGADGVRTYVIAVQNPAEARATGGLVTGYAIAQVDKGRIDVVRSGINRDLARFTPSTGNFDLTGFELVYAQLAAGGAGRTAAMQTWAGSNATPDWLIASSRMATLWTAQTGQRVDAVLGLNPRAIGRILTETGPVRLSDGTTVTGANAEHYMQVEQYSQFAESNPARKAANAELAEKALDKLISAKLSLNDLQSIAAGGLKAGDFQLASTHADEQRLLDETAIGSVLPRTGPFVQVTTQNIGGGKMDAFIRRDVAVARAADETSVTVRLTNRPPAVSSLSPTQTLRLDDHRAAAVLGSTRELVSVYAGPSATFSTVTIDGKAARFTSGVEATHPFVTVDLDLEPGVTHTIVVTLRDAPGRIRYRVQPLAVPEKVTLPD